jgi:hypothetical protein
MTDATRRIRQLLLLLTAVGITKLNGTNTPPAVCQQNISGGNNACVDSNTSTASISSSISAKDGAFPRISVIDRSHYPTSAAEAACRCAANPHPGNFQTTSRKRRNTRVISYVNRSTSHPLPLKRTVTITLN